MKDKHSNWSWPIHSFLDDVLDDISKVVGNEHLETRPKMNALESENGYSIQLATPGFQRDELKIDLKGKLLVVEGKKDEDETTDTSKKFKRREFYYTNFSRSFELPEGLDVNNIKASYENGVLFINLPKVKEEETVDKTIQID